MVNANVQWNGIADGKSGYCKITRTGTCAIMRTRFRDRQQIKVRWMQNIRWRRVLVSRWWIVVGILCCYWMVLSCCWAWYLTIFPRGHSLRTDSRFNSDHQKRNWWVQQDWRHASPVDYRNFLIEPAQCAILISFHVYYHRVLVPMQ